jgi:site-specific DNA recombinase
MQRFAIYARYSTDRQSETSIEDQIRRCTEHVHGRGGIVVATYKDEAMSGAKFRSRPAVQQLLEDADQPRRRPFDCVIVDDLSRLSREMLTALSVIFTRLKRAGVVFVDRQSGSASNNPQSLVYFTAVALAAELQRESSRSQTHRGLEGLFQKGRSTGGRCLGFVTRNGKPAIDEAQAELVRRIFKAYASGQGHKAIAEALNAEAIPAPYDGVITKRQGHGWSHTTIRNILRNERYIGIWRWNERAFDRRSNGPSESRLPRKREANEVRTDERPELRILPQELWEAAQARHEGRRRRAGGRAPGEARTPYLAGGLLVCGVCGAHFGVVGQRTKNGRKYRTLGCSAHQSRGRAICANSRTVSEKRIAEHLEAALRRLLSDRAFLDEVKRTYLLAASGGLEQSPSSGAHHTRDIAQLEKARANLLRVIEAADEVDDALANRYAELGRKLAALKAETPSAPLTSGPLPQASDVDGFVRELRLVLSEQVPAANAALRAALPQKLRMVPKFRGPDHFYEVTGALEFSGPLSGYSEGLCCGGRI